MERLKDFFDETSKFIFASSVVLLIIAHGFCFMNIMYSHDSLVFPNITPYGKVGLGRWLYPFLANRRLMATPWLMGVLSIIYVSLAVVLTSKVLELNRIQGLCVGILFSTNVALTSLFCTYIYDADADCLALLLACFSVYSFKTYKKRINIVLSFISVVLCLALYQAYICVAIGLFILVLIEDALESDCWNDILKVLINGIKELVTLILGVVIYVPIMHVVANNFGVELSSEYNGPGNLDSLKVRDVIKCIPNVYDRFIDSFYNITEYNTTSILRINVLLTFVIVISILYYISVHKKFWGSLTIIVPCVLILPLGLNAIYIVSFGLMHQLMIFAFCLVYLLPFIFANYSTKMDDSDYMAKMKKIRKAICVITIVAIVYIGFSNIVYSNGAYVYKKLVYDNTVSHAQTIWKDINSVEGYEEGQTLVVFMGDFSSSNVAYNGIVGKRYLNTLVGATNSAITYPGTVDVFYNNIMGRDLNISYNDEDISQSSEFIEMPMYPAEGYCRMIGDKVVVKIQN